MPQKPKHPTGDPKDAQLTDESGTEVEIRLLRELEPFIRAFCKASNPKQTFLNSLRASLCKSFEFCFEACENRTKPIAFFLVTSLRSICEDIIVLSYLTKMSSEDRDDLIGLLMRHELANQTAAQKKSLI